MVYDGKSMYIAWGHTATFKGGNTATDKHIPFNPLKAVPTPADGLQEKTSPEYMANSLVPQVMVEQLLETGKVTFQAYYRDPFMMLTAFTHKTMPTVWTGTNNTIAANFSESDHIDYIWIQVHVHDQLSTNHLDYFFDGGVITEYKWIIEAGKTVIEEFTIEFASLPVAVTTAIDIDNGFDDGAFDRSGIDGGWSMWNGAYTASTCAHSKDATITFNTSAIAVLNIKKCTIGFKKVKKFEPVSNSKIMGLVYEQTHEYFMDCEGVLVSNTSHAQVLTIYASKTTGVCSVVVGYNTLQFTIGYLDSIDNMVDIAEKLAAQEVTFHYKGGASTVMSFAWVGSEATDPESMIQHDNV